MKTIKIIVGAFIGYGAIRSMLEMLQQDSGAYLFGGFISFLLLGSLSFWLIYSGLKNNDNK